VKTAISIPDDVFDAAERVAREENVSRSELYVKALRKLLAERESITESLNRVYADDGSTDPAVLAASRRILDTTEW